MRPGWWSATHKCGRAKGCVLQRQTVTVPWHSKASVHALKYDLKACRIVARCTIDFFLSGPMPACWCACPAAWIWQTRPRSAYSLHNEISVSMTRAPQMLDRNVLVETLEAAGRAWHSNPSFCQARVPLPGMHASKHARPRSLQGTRAHHCLQNGCDWCAPASFISLRNLVQHSGCLARQDDAAWLSRLSQEAVLNCEHCPGVFNWQLADPP